MARLTVEDCLKNVKNRFDLVLLASKRARQLARGYEPLVEEEADKPTVMALREIAGGLIDYEKVEAIETREQMNALAEGAEEQPPAEEPMP